MDLNQYLDPATITSLQTGGYLLMLALMIVEGPIVTFISAFLASLGIFDVFLVFILGWMGDIIGDLLFYSIGRFGWHIFQKSTTIKNKKESVFIQKLDHLINTNLALAILVIKFTPYAPPIGLTYIGKMHVDFRKYLLTSLILCIPVPIIATLIGYHTGLVSSVFQKYTGTTLLIFVAEILSVIGLSLWLYFSLKKKGKKVLDNQQKNN